MPATDYLPHFLLTLSTGYNVLRREPHLGASLTIGAE